jgi:hydrogenase expression/formation protein HypC
MCLAIPGKIIELDGSNALVDFDGVKRKVVVGLLANVEVGTYVIVHAGYAIETVDEKAAAESISTWNELVKQENLNKEDII